MSWEAQAWAAKQKTGSSSRKLLLIYLASYTDANHECWPSQTLISEETELDRKTIIDALAFLTSGDFPLIEDTGRRKGRTKQVKVYRLASFYAEHARTDPDAQTVPKAEQFRKRNSSVIPRKRSRKRDTEPSKEPKTLSPPKGGTSPRSKSKRSGSRKRSGERLPDDWAPPDTSDLSTVAAGFVTQWPPGAYETVCEVFRLHYQTEEGPSAYQSAWNAVLSKWLIKDHAKIMRDARAGVSFAAMAPRDRKKPIPKRARIVSKRLEDDRSDRVHSILKRQLGNQLYEQWFAPMAIVFEADRLLVRVDSEFARDWITDRFRDRLGEAAREVAGYAIRTVDIALDCP